MGGAGTGGVKAPAAAVAAVAGVQHLGQGRLHRLELLLEQQDLPVLCRERASRWPFMMKDTEIRTFHHAWSSETCRSCAASLKRWPRASKWPRA